MGRNEITVERPQRWRQALGRLWAPVPWMLEATVALELVLGHCVEAAIIAAVLAVNVAIGFVQEGRAQAALELLRRRLEVRARVLRDGSWTTVPAAELVPGDVVHVRAGDVVPADLALRDGALAADQSALTGESLPVELAAGEALYSGSTIARGEASGTVSATGPGTFFGRTAELVRTARTETHLERVVLGLVRWFIALDLGLAVVVSAVAAARGEPAHEIVSFALVLLLASVPVALPAAFTLVGALGATELARSGVLATRMSAVQEAATMDTVCVDKTGTITSNRLTLDALRPQAPLEEWELLALAGAASDPATQDPLDMAILKGGQQRNVAALGSRLGFTPFDPHTKRSEALVVGDRGRMRITKGAPQAIAALTRDGPGEADVAELAAAGARVLGVAVADGDGPWRHAGLVALRDAPRPDAAALVRELHALGVGVIMVSGDTLATARSIATEVGIEGRAARTPELRAEDANLGRLGVVAEVLPEDKYELVRSLQRAGHVVGMTGDGVNDAPALRQAEVGIAVASATDVAKQAASIVLTRPGLADIVELIKSSRRIHQRSVTYALNVAAKKIEVPLLLSFGVLVWRQFLFTPLLMALLLLANDIVSIAIVSDRAPSARAPEHWRNRELLLGALVVALPLLAVSLSVVWVGRDVWPQLSLDPLRTLIFLTLVYSSQATIYLVRVRGRIWSARPGRWLLTASVIDLAAFSALALIGGPLAPLSAAAVAALALTILGAAVALDSLKVRLFGSLGIHRV